MCKKIFSILFLVFIAAVFTVLAGCGGQTAPNAKTVTPKLKVIATVYPVYEFVKQVGGDKVDAAMLIPPGVEPHDWEPKISELMKIKTAKLFFYHGAGLEPTDKLLTKEILGDSRAVEVSRGIATLVEAQHNDEGEDAGHHHDSGIDPHMWLDPVAAQQEVNNIAEALSSADPDNQAYYQANAKRYCDELAQLDQSYRDSLSTVAHREIITSHSAFAYLAKRYNLTQIGIMGLSPDAEPTPERMAKIVAFCREHHVRYIFFEMLVSPKLSQAIAAETGAKLLVLNPLESLTEEELQQGKNYISVMQENLQNLKQALNN